MVQASHLESARILDATADEATRQRGECDEYVDGKLSEFADLLSHTLRTVSKGRAHLRSGTTLPPAPPAAEPARPPRSITPPEPRTLVKRVRARRTSNTGTHVQPCPNNATARGSSTPGNWAGGPVSPASSARVVEAQTALGVEGVIAVPKGAQIELDVLLESVVEGVLVSGTAVAPVAGECARCLDPISADDHDVEVEFTELFAYPASITEETTDEDEVFRLVDDKVDLEPVVRDAVVLALPAAPLCQDDCRDCARTAAVGGPISVPITGMRRLTLGGPRSRSGSARIRDA